MTLGYDYYGTVVNTAARVEGVGHGGQTLITEETYEALDERRAVGEATAAEGVTNNGAFSNAKMIAIRLGACPIRGLDEPIKLVQIAPRDDGNASGSITDYERELSCDGERTGSPKEKSTRKKRELPKGIGRRSFPALRLHIEVGDVVDTTTADEMNTGDGTGTGASSPNAIAAELAHQLCSTRQFAGLVTAEEVMVYYLFVNALIAPTPAKWQRESLAKLGTSWGIENAAADVGKGGGGAFHVSAAGARLMVNLAAKVGRSVRMRSRREAAASASVNGQESSSNGNSRAGGVLSATHQQQRAFHSSRAGGSVSGFTGVSRRLLHSDSFNHTMPLAAAALTFFRPATVTPPLFLSST